jgi:hypothetical protein
MCGPQRKRMVLAVAGDVTDHRAIEEALGQCRATFEGQHESMSISPR